MLYLLAIKIWTQQCWKFAEDKCSQVKARFQTFGLKLAALSLYACQKMWGKKFKTAHEHQLGFCSKILKTKKEKEKETQEKNPSTKQEQHFPPCPKEKFFCWYLLLGICIMWLPNSNQKTYQTSFIWDPANITKKDYKEISVWKTRHVCCKSRLLKGLHIDFLPNWWYATA